MNTERANTVTEVKNLVFIEVLKGLILINGGGAIALATWIQTVWEKYWAPLMLPFQLWGMVGFAFGVLFAVVALAFRFMCFFHKYTLEPQENPWWWGHMIAIACSVLSFLVATGLVVYGAFQALAVWVPQC